MIRTQKLLRMISLQWLRACDKKGVDVILAAALKEDGIGFAVMNRMFKSAGYHIKEVL